MWLPSGAGVIGPNLQFQGLKVFVSLLFKRLSSLFCLFVGTSKPWCGSTLSVARQRQKQALTDSHTMNWLVAPRVRVYIVSRAARNGGKDSTNTNKGEI